MLEYYILDGVINDLLKCLKEKEKVYLQPRDILFIPRRSNSCVTSQSSTQFIDKICISNPTSRLLQKFNCVTVNFTSDWNVSNPL